MLFAVSICHGINYPITYSSFDVQYMALGAMDFVSYMLYA